MTDKPKKRGPIKPVKGTLVDAAGVQSIQMGYEARLARQKMAIGRLSDLLEERTADVYAHMQRANAAARASADALDNLTAIQASADTARATADDATEELDRVRLDWEALVIRLVPVTWDLYNEDDDAQSILEAYVKWLKGEVEDAKGKQAAIARERDECVTTLAAANLLVTKLKGEIRNMRLPIVQGSPAQVFQNDDPDRPPWEGGRMSAVQPAEINRTTPMTPDPMPGAGDSETVGWDGFKTTSPTDETRPGGF